MADSLVDDLVEDFNNGKQFTLNDYETGFLKELHAMLQYHIYRDRIMTAFMTYVAMTRFGYTKVKEGYDLQYGIETETEPYKLRIKEVKREV